MRIRVWNVNKGFQSKAQEAFRGNPDVVVLPESPRDFVRDGWAWGWAGRNRNSGIGIGISNALHRTDLRRICTQREWFSIVELDLPEPTVVVGVWACYSASPRKREMGPTNSSLPALIKEIGDRRAIVAGDFNNGSYWDQEGRADNFQNTVNALRDAGLVSAYHQFHEKEFGAEADPTFYSKRQETSPHHIDYCFIPEDWCERLDSVEVGRYQDWISLSDHMPLTINLTDPI
ncbi:endonuclease/exonuclease/phosphatase family protein [Haloferula sp.]|uniref:endonuclease/exonuclease/phosphatase family protein n=1 Tax=Haloferula sp. TaxID=2497595 RepID=UPI00329CFC68